MKSKSEMMKRLREQRKAAGLVRFEAYVTKAVKAKLVELIKTERGLDDENNTTSNNVNVINSCTVGCFMPEPKRSKF